LTKQLLVSQNRHCSTGLLFRTVSSGGFVWAW